MGGYGYRFQSYTAYANMGSRTGEIFGPVTLFPNSGVNPEDYFNYDDHAPRRTLVPVSTNPYDDDYRHGSPTKAYPVHGTMIPVATRDHGSCEYPISSPTKLYQAGDDGEWYRPHRDDELLAKRVTVPVVSRPFGVDEYGHGSPKKADRDGKSHEVLTKRTVVPVVSKPNGPEYERSSPTIHKAQASQPAIWTEWRRPQRSAPYNGNEEEPKAFDATNKSGKPIISEEWSSSPRKGTILSEPMVIDDIDKVAEKFIQNARLARASEGEHKSPKSSAKNTFSTPNYESRDRRNLGVYRPAPTFPSNHAPASPPLVDARRGSATIDCWEAERRYNGQRV